MIVATSWFLVTLIGIGMLPAWLMAGPGGRKVRHFLPVALMLGLLADHAVGLITGSLDGQSRFAWLGLAGIFLLLRLRPTRACGARSLLPLAAILILVAMVAMAIFTLPLGAWDARSIWFFHGKVDYFAGGVRAGPFWSDHAYDWSHKDYPQLLPMLAARFADFIAGGWNETAPKGGLLILLLSGLGGLLAAVRTGPGRSLLLVAACLAVAGKQAWNGYADIWFALHGAAAVVAMARWAEAGDREALVLAAASWGVALCLKTEAALLSAALLPLLGLGLWRNRRKLIWRDAALPACFLPFLLWRADLVIWHVTGATDSAGVLLRAGSVLAQGGVLASRLTLLGQEIYLRSALLELSVLALLVARSRQTASILALSLAYVVGLAVVYLGTPYDFAWHLDTSLDRVLMLPEILALTALTLELSPTSIPGRNSAPGSGSGESRDCSAPAGSRHI